MDFKRNKNLILGGVGIVSAVILMVLLLNYDQLVPKKDSAQVVKPTTPDFETQVEVPSDLRKFVHDPTFFDKEDAYEMEEEVSTQLLLQVTSVEKDLRINIVNRKGELVAGEPFFVSLNQTDTYKDLDQDGMIYIGGLTAGNYDVALQDVPSYDVSNTKASVTVKEKLEYRMIDDISYLVKTEDEIDTAIDDTAQKNAADEGSDTQDVNPKFSDEGYTFGIDVSSWNKDIDWQQVADYGVDFAVIRMGYRGSSTGSLVEDAYFRKNVEGATSAGIKVGLYFFTQAVSEVEAVEEASIIASLAKSYNIDYPIFVDTEGAGGNGRADGLDVDMRTKVCNAFCQTIENAGYTPGIYASKNWYNNNIDYETLSKYTIWMAQYTDVPTFEQDYHMWQYTSGGSVPGIDGRVDLNISYIK